MAIGPILWRELITAARRRSTYTERVVAAGVLAGIVGLCLAGWDLAGRERGTVAGQSRLALTTFGVIVAFYGLGVLTTIPTAIAPAIAAERERKSLDALLATRLSNAQVVLGVLAAGLVRGMSGLASGLAVMALLAPSWGLDPRLVLLAFAGLASTGFALGALAVAASVESRTIRLATAGAVGLAIAWLVLPLLVVMLLPRLWPWGARLMVPAAVPLLDSGPLALAMNLAGVLRRGALVEATWRMIALQAAGGAVLIAWATLRLRRASRALYDGDTLALIRRLGRAGGARRRPPCGDDPVLWYEKYRARGASRLDELFSRLIAVALAVAVLAGVLWVARPAFRELGARGYGPSGAKALAPEVHPLVRWMVLGLHAEPPAGQARTELNTVVRQATASFYLMLFVVLTAFAVESVTAERERDTWSGLIATPLSGREILGAKMLASAWRTRWYVAVMAGLWALGLAAGAVHPLGFALSAAGLVASAWFYTALGVHAALWARGRDGSTNLIALLLVVVSLGGALPFLLPAPGASVLMGAASMPLIGWLALFSYDDLAIAVRSGAFPRLAEGGIRTGEGAAAVLATCLVGIAAQAAAALLLTRAAFRRFDEAVGRPIRRASGPPGAAAGAPRRPGRRAAEEILHS